MCRKIIATHAWLCMVGAVLGACGSEKQAPDTAPPAPSVALLELPVALRSQAKVPADAVQVDVTTAGIGVAGKLVLNLAAGGIDKAERPGAEGDELPKLVQALKAAPQHAHVSLAVAALVPYETAASVIASAKAAGASSIVFHVRAPSVSAVGYLALDDFELRARSKSDEAVAVPGVAVRPWSDFVAQWDAVANACRSARTGNCAPKPESVADGGDLKVVLHAAGQGVNVEFFRIGPPPEVTPPPEAKDKGKGKAKKHAKKSRKKPVEEPTEPVEPVIPATEALFQFRGQEAVTAPSPVSETVKPVCGDSACGVIVQAEKATPFLRVVSLLGAAFPDATPAPHVVFERP